MMKLMGVTKTCGTVKSGGPCSVSHVFSSDSGKYWCEAKGARTTSDSLNINITDGSVILDSPALQVMEEDNVTLHCGNKTTSSVLIADFYKDGVNIATGYDGYMTIRNVSKSDEGLYKCNIIGVGESAESWLAVRGDLKQNYTELYHDAHTFTVSPSLHQATNPTHNHSHRFLIPWNNLTLFLMALLLLLMGIFLYGKHRVLVFATSKASTPSSQLEEGQTEQETSSSTVTPNMNTSSADTEQCTTNPDAFYSTIYEVIEKRDM
uniref:Immunoglobulin domain-containing protein n=1 Tax=Anabas testudineus TaxID=64144 RepID=A0AAQ6IBZ7_ANATE